MKRRTRKQRKAVLWLTAALLCGIVCCTVLCNSADARPRSRAGRGFVSVVASVPAGLSNRTAQGVAEIMARLGRVGHFGGNSPYSEGCGSASTKDAAYRICCYANDPNLVTVDVGYAQRGDMYFCCRRYARRQSQ